MSFGTRFGKNCNISLRLIQCFFMKDNLLKTNILVKNAYVNGVLYQVIQRAILKLVLKKLC